MKALLPRLKDGTSTPALVASKSRQPQAASAPTGAVYLVSWWDKMDPDLHSTAEVRILGAAAGDQIGTSLASGDFDGDGINDVLIGAHTHDGQDGTTNVGAAYLIPGATLREYIGGDLDLETPPADVIVFEGSEQDEELGSSVVLADVDGDGLDDAVIGASMHDGNGTNSGAVFIVYGVGL